MAQLKSTNITGNLSVTGNVLASKIIKLGGTADEILCADGSTTTLSGLGAGTVTSVTVTGSNGLTGTGTITSTGTITLSHADTSSQASMTTGGRTYINSITLDGYGHVTAIGTGTESNQDLSNYVDKTTPQEISGVKTFTAQPVINTANGLKFDSGNCKLRIYNASDSPTDYAAIEVRSNSTSTNRNLFIDLANNSLVVGTASGTPDNTYKVNVKDTFNATTVYEDGKRIATQEWVENLGYVTGSYLPLAGGTMNANAIITLPNSAKIIHHTNTTSNYVTDAVWYKGTSAVSPGYDAQIGWHNTGDTNGAIIILPYTTTSDPWSSSVGLYISKTRLKYNNTNISLEGHGHTNMVTGTGLTADKIVVGNGESTIKTSSKGIVSSITSTDDNNLPTSKAVATYVTGLLEDLELSDSYQPLDADLTAIAGLTGTSGLLKKTASNNWSLDTNTYLRPGNNATENYLAFFKDGDEVSGSQNTHCDGAGNIKAASYGIYTNLTTKTTATWQYNSSTDCVELVWA